MSNTGVTVGLPSIVATPKQTYKLSDMFQIDPNSGVDQILIQTYDRDLYADAQTYDYGTLYANGVAVPTSPWREGVSANITFTLIDGDFVDSNGVSLNKYTYTASEQQDRLQNINIYGNAHNIKGDMTSGYTQPFLQNIQIVTDSNFLSHNTNPTTPTAAQVVANAQSHIGEVWNTDGCWLLASQNAAESGASLSWWSGWIDDQHDTQTDNGAWKKIYNSHTTPSDTWQYTLKGGDIVSCDWKTGFNGHIFTIEKIVNDQAILVDNSENVFNIPGDGGRDVIVQEKDIGLSSRKDGFNSLTRHYNIGVI